METSTFPDVVGTTGVALLLLAFFLNLRGTLPTGGRTYQGLNTIGAGLACYASWLIGFMPFVVLEGTWCIVAAVTLFGNAKKGSAASA